MLEVIVAPIYRWFTYLYPHLPQVGIVHRGHEQSLWHLTHVPCIPHRCTPGSFVIVGRNFGKILVVQLALHVQPGINRSSRNHIVFITLSTLSDELIWMSVVKTRQHRRIYRYKDTHLGRIHLHLHPLLHLRQPRLPCQGNGSRQAAYDDAVKQC